MPERTDRGDDMRITIATLDPVQWLLRGGSPMALASTIVTLEDAWPGVKTHQIEGSNAIAFTIEVEGSG